MTALPKIVHVEDDPDIRGIAQIGLVVVAGLTLVQFSSGQEAMDGV